MKNKNLHSFRVNSPIFREGRFLNVFGPLVSDDAEKSSEEPSEVITPPKRAVEIGAEKEEVKVAAAIERGEVKKDLPKTPVEVPKKAPLAESVFVEMVSSGRARNDLDLLKINPLREDLHIAARTWVHTTPEGLAKIYQDIRDLDIPVRNNDFYQTMFAVLLNAATPAANTNLAEHRDWFQNPFAHVEELSALAPKDGFWGGEQFLKAFDHLNDIKGLLLEQDSHQLGTSKKQEEFDKDPISTKATDFVRDNLGKFTKAIRERDYATAGLYVAGIWALYRSVQKLTEGERGASVKKWLIYGSALYAGNIFLKNAGYDVLKMAGFRDPDYEVSGTPMEVMRNVLSSHPDLKVRETTNDLDYGVVLRCADLKLTSLEKLFQQSNGVEFIHPYEFPEIFPDLANQWGPFKMGLGERGLNDPGMSNEKLTSKQREYVRVGQQLYKMAYGLRKSYEITLQKEHSAYIGVPYEDAIQDPTRSLGKVRHLWDAIRPWSPTAHKETLFSRRKEQEVQDNLGQAFEGLDEANFSIDSKIGEDHYSGWLTGFPVVFVLDDNDYRVYLRNEYGKKYNPVPGRNCKAKIPAKNEAPNRTTEAKKAIEGVKGRVKELVERLEPFRGADGRELLTKTLTYEGGTWKCKVKLPGAEDLGVAATKADAQFEPFPDGTGILPKLPDPLLLSLLPKITGQAEFRALQVFNRGRALRVEDPTLGDGRLTLLIGKKRLELEVKYDKDYDKDKDKFEIVGGGEKALLGDPSFAQEYIDALSADEQFELNKTIDKWKTFIKYATEKNESLIPYFFKAITQETNRSPLDGINLDLISGSVPEYFSIMVLETGRSEVMQRLRRGIIDADSLGKVEEEMTKSIQGFNSRLMGLYGSISAENARLTKTGESWDRDQFTTKVIDQIRAASSVSSTYAHEKKDMEYLVYSLSLPGLLKKSDLSSMSHEIVGKLMGVFAYYTAHLDNANLDDLASPPTPTPGVNDPKKDPALKPWYTLRYFEYVKHAIHDRAASMDDLSTIPVATAKQFWGIDEFDKWKINGTFAPLDSKDEGRILTNDVELHKLGKHTVLGDELIKRLKVAGQFLVIQGADSAEIEDYFNASYKNAGGEWKSPDEWGLTVITEEDGEHFSKLWQITKRISDLAGKRRSTQDGLIQREVDNFLERAFKEPYYSRFFKNKSAILDFDKFYDSLLLRYRKWKHDI